MVRFRVDAADIKKNVVDLLKIIKTRSFQPILAAVYFKAAGDKLLMVGATQEAQLYVESGAVIEEEGEFLLPAKIAADIFKDAEGEVHFEISEGNVFIKMESVEYKLRVVPADDYPYKEVPTFEGRLTLPSEVMDLIVKKVAIAAATDPVDIMSGVLLEFEEGKVTAVASDNYRLAWYEFGIDNQLVGERYIVPQAVFARLADISDEEVYLTFSEGKVFAKGDRGAVLISNLLQGSFPNWRQVIPQMHTTMIEFEKREFQQALKRVVPMAEDRRSGVKLSISSEKIVLEIMNSQFGEVKSNVPLLSFEGEEMEITFGINYLAAGVDAAEEDTVVLKLAGPMSAAYLSSGKFNYILVPMRVI